jgi:hypothetical protein
MPPRRILPATPSTLGFIGEPLLLTPCPRASAHPHRCSSTEPHHSFPSKPPATVARPPTRQAWRLALERSRATSHRLTGPLGCFGFWARPLVSPCEPQWIPTLCGGFKSFFELLNNRNCFQILKINRNLRKCPKYTK